jgi:ATP-dependent Clp protease ATP-binding subunit ClpA
MRACNVDLGRLRSALLSYFETKLQTMLEGHDTEPTPTVEYEGVIRRVLTHSRASDRREITGASMLPAILAERNSCASELLQEQGMTQYHAMNYIVYGISKNKTISQ